MRGMISAGWHWGATAGAPLLQRMLERRVVRGKEEAARLVRPPLSQLSLSASD